MNEIVYTVISGSIGIVKLYFSKSNALKYNCVRCWCIFGFITRKYNKNKRGGIYYDDMIKNNILFTFPIFKYIFWLRI